MPQKVFNNEVTTTDGIAPNGISGVVGVRNRYVNLIIHDTTLGMFFNAEAENNTVYGCIIYNNGWVIKAIGHGHGIYLQNNNGRRLVKDNIIFNQFDYGTHAYTSGSDTRHIDFDGNIIFN